MASSAQLRAFALSVFIVAVSVTLDLADATQTPAPVDGASVDQPPAAGQDALADQAPALVHVQSRRCKRTHSRAPIRSPSRPPTRTRSRFPTQTPLRSSTFTRRTTSTASFTRRPTSTASFTRPPTSTVTSALTPTRSVTAMVAAIAPQVPTATGTPSATPTDSPTPSAFLLTPTIIFAPAAGEPCAGIAVRPFCKEPVDVIFTIDGSGSIGGNFSVVTKFVEEIVCMLNITQEAVHAGVIQFRGPSADGSMTTATKLEAALSGFRPSLMRKIRNIVEIADGWSRLDLGYDATLTQGFGALARPGATQITVALTDGRIQEGYDSPPCLYDDGCLTYSNRAIISSQKLQANGISVAVLAVAYYDLQRLFALSSGPDYVFVPETWADASSFMTTLARLICDEPARRRRGKKRRHASRTPSPQ